MRRPSSRCCPTDGRPLPTTVGENSYELDVEVWGSATREWARRTGERPERPCLWRWCLREADDPHRDSRSGDRRGMLGDGAHGARCVAMQGALVLVDAGGGESKRQGERCK